MPPLTPPVILLCASVLAVPVIHPKRQSWIWRGVDSVSLAKVTRARVACFVSHVVCDKPLRAKERYPIEPERFQTRFGVPPSGKMPIAFHLCVTKMYGSMLYLPGLWTG
jgi:hypothetical protein